MLLDGLQGYQNDPSVVQKVQKRSLLRINKPVVKETFKNKGSIFRCVPGCERLRRYIQIYKKIYPTAMPLPKRHAFPCKILMLQLCNYSPNPLTASVMIFATRPTSS